MIRRENRDSAISVQSDITEVLQGATVSNELALQLITLEHKWKLQGFSVYRVGMAGAVKECSKDSASIAAVLPT